MSSKVVTVTSFPRISIVTPSFNQGRYIREALESVRRQGYPRVEHIVMDGGSTDQTVEVLRSSSMQPGYSHLKWTSEPDRGQSHALNKGFHAASGDVIGWLNSDDRYRPQCFERVINAFAAYPNADIVYGDYTWMTETGNVFRIRREIDFHRFVYLYHRISFIPTTSAFFRRTVFDDGNFVDENFKYAMDFEFFVRLVNKGYRIIHIPHLLGDFRWQPASKSSATPEKQIEEHNRVARSYSTFLKKFSVPTTQSAALGILRFMAASLRYSEKLCRGYYFPERITKGLNH